MRSASRRHPSMRSKRHPRSRRRQRTSTSTSGLEALTDRTESPIIPPVYPYALPPYAPYTYPYTAAAPAATTATTPAPSPTSASGRGPRAARSHRHKGASEVKHPHAPFQRPVIPPQLFATVPLLSMPGVPMGYFITPSRPHGQDGDGNGAPGTAAAGPIQPGFVHYIPVALGPDGVPARFAPAHTSVPVENMRVSPPVEPQKTTAAANIHSVEVVAPRLKPASKMGARNGGITPAPNKTEYLPALPPVPRFQRRPINSSQVCSSFWSPTSLRSIDVLAG
jgi:hypothetical protein